MAQFTDEQLQRKIQEGFIVESETDMTETYKKALIGQLTVQGDTELMSAPAYYMAAKDAPSTNTMVSATAIIQDEMGHANIAYRLLQDLGVDTDYLLYDRAGITLLSDVHRNTSYGPLKRALVKVGMEENFHLRHGEVWMRRLCEAGGEGRDLVQRAVDWMFPMGVEWFGLPDDRKRHNAQLDFKLKGMTNDELRMVWLKAVVPLCEQLGVRVPAHSNEDTGEVALEYELPIAWNADDRVWLLDETITWDAVWDRWRARGPMNEEFVESVRRSRFQVEDLLAA